MENLSALVETLYTILMSGLYSDTHPKMEARQIQLWRQASPTRKMHLLADLLLREELACRVYGELKQSS